MSVHVFTNYFITTKSLDNIGMSLLFSAFRGAGEGRISCFGRVEKPKKSRAPQDSFRRRLHLNLSYDGGFTDLSFAGGGALQPAPPLFFAQTKAKPIIL